MYAWKGKSKNSKVHMLNSRGFSYCQVENTTKLDMRNQNMPSNRQICSLCISLKKAGTHECVAPKYIGKKRKSQNFVQKEWIPPLSNEDYGHIRSIFTDVESD